MKKRHFKRKPIRGDRTKAPPVQEPGADCPSSPGVPTRESTELPADESVGELLPALAAQPFQELAPMHPEPKTKAPDGFKLQAHRRTEGEVAIAARLRERSKALHGLRDT